MTATTPQNTGLQLTLKILGQIRNPAATDVLAGALLAPEPEVARGALEALLHRWDAEARVKIVAAYASMQPEVRAGLMSVDARRRLRPGLTRAIAGDDPRLSRDASRIAIDLQDFESLPAIIAAASHGDHPAIEPLAAAAYRLASALSQQMEVLAKPSGGPDPMFLRRTVYLSLQQAVERYAEHKRPELAEALLAVAKLQDEGFRRLLNRPTHAAYPVLLTSLRKGKSEAVLRVVAECWLDPTLPADVRQLAAQRTDKGNMQRLLEMVGNPPTARAIAAASTAGGAPVWLAPAFLSTILTLPAEQQGAAAQLAAQAPISAEDRLSVISAIFDKGPPKARAAACTALALVQSPTARDVLEGALKDSDPAVVVAALRSLRRCGHPQADRLLVGLLDHPSSSVLAAAQGELTQLRMETFVPLFPALSAALRRAAGRLVAKADPNAAEAVSRLIRSQIDEQQELGLALVESMGLQERCSAALVEVSASRNSAVRAEVGRLLGAAGRSPLVLSALERLAYDSHPSVREAVQTSLDGIGHPGLTPAQ